MTPPDLSIFMRDCIPGAQLALIPEAGHCVMVENVEAFNQAVIEFISSLPDTPHG
jgi:pimeloyl-ACP methyl ester carboxylesterase